LAIILGCFVAIIISMAFISRYFALATSVNTMNKVNKFVNILSNNLVNSKINISESLKKIDLFFEKSSKYLDSLIKK